MLLGEIPFSPGFIRSHIGRVSKPALQVLVCLTQTGVVTAPLHPQSLVGSPARIYRRAILSKCTGRDPSLLLSIRMILIHKICSGATSWSPLRKIIIKHSFLLIGQTLMPIRRSLSGGEVTEGYTGAASAFYIDQVRLPCLTVRHHYFFASRRQAQELRLYILNPL
jgi:hypothetical protein